MFHRIKRGLKNHPGNIYICVLVLAGFVAGMDKGFIYGLLGSALMFTIFGTPWLYTAWEIGKEENDE